MKIPFTPGICMFSIFKLSKENQRMGHLEETQMDKSQEKGGGEGEAPKQAYRVKLRGLPSTNTQEIFSLTLNPVGCLCVFRHKSAGIFRTATFFMA